MIQTPIVCVLLQSPSTAEPCCTLASYGNHSRRTMPTDATSMPVPSQGRSLFGRFVCMLASATVVASVAFSAIAIMYPPMRTHVTDWDSAAVPAKKVPRPYIPLQGELEM